MAKRPSTSTLLPVELVMLIQYVTAVALARCTATDHEISGAVVLTESGTTVQMTCSVAGQLNVNQRCV